MLPALLGKLHESVPLVSAKVSYFPYRTTLDTTIQASSSMQVSEHVDVIDQEGSESGKK